MQPDTITYTDEEIAHAADNVYVTIGHLWTILKTTQARHPRITQKTIAAWADSLRETESMIDDMQEVLTGDAQFLE